MAKALVSNYSAQIAEIFGLEPDTLGEFTVTIRPGNVIVLTAQIYPSDSQINEWVELMRRYRIEEVADD